MAYEFIYRRRIEFAETDLAGIVHFANFYRMMENAEHAFFRSLGFSVHHAFDGQLVGWPRVSAACEFMKPLRFEDEVDVHLLVAEIRNRSLRYGFRFWKEDGAVRVEVARGQVTTVCAAMDRLTGKMGAVAIPAVLRDLLQVAPAELLSVFVPGRQGE